MAYYDTFLRATKPPNETWKQGLQALVDSEFINASTYYQDVEEEVEFGTLEFRQIDVRVNSLVDAKTGQRINEDYKSLIFPNINYHVPVGTRFRFDNNIWIVFSVDNIKTDTASVYVRRCNNVMITQDDYGNIHEEPVYLDYKVTENQLFRNYTVDVPSGRIQFFCQNNKWTKHIDINDRFIFGQDVYKVRERSEFDRRNTFDKNSVHMLSFYADLDNKGENDNFQLNIANYKLFDYRIDVINSIIDKVDTYGKVIASVYLNNSILDDEPIIYTSTNEDIAVIDENTGEFKLLSPGNCEFICRMANKISISSSINVIVEKNIEVEPKYECVITPDTGVIKLNKTVGFSVYEFVNGIQTDTVFYIDCSGVSNKNYEFIAKNGNEFSITNLKQSEHRLKITCKNAVKDKNKQYKKEFYIRLGGIL